MIDLEKIKEVLNGPIGKPLKDYLLAELNDLKSIDNVQEHSKAQDQAVELKAQIKAYKKLSEIFTMIMTISKEVTEENENEYIVP